MPFGNSSAVINVIRATSVCPLTPPKKSTGAKTGESNTNSKKFDNKLCSRMNFFFKKKSPTSVGCFFSFLIFLFFIKKNNHLAILSGARGKRGRIKRGVLVRGKEAGVVVGGGGGRGGRVKDRAMHECMSIE